MATREEVLNRLLFECLGHLEELHEKGTVYCKDFEIFLNHVKAKKSKLEATNDVVTIEHIKDLLVEAKYDTDKEFFGGRCLYG